MDQNSCLAFLFNNTPIKNFAGMMKLFLIAYLIYISVDTSLRELSKEFNIL